MYLAVYSAKQSARRPAAAMMNKIVSDIKSLPVLFLKKDGYAQPPFLIMY